MTKSNSIQSFPHCKEIWDEAFRIASENPDASVLIPLTTLSEQATLIGDLFHYRLLVRKENSKFFPQGHPQHMTSIFDPFQVLRAMTKDGRLAVRIKRRKATDFQI